MLREQSALIVKIHKGLDLALTVISFVGAYFIRSWLSDPSGGLIAVHYLPIFRHKDWRICDLHKYWQIVNLGSGTSANLYGGCDGFSVTIRIAVKE